MKKVGIVIAAVFAMAMFAGCSSHQSAPAASASSMPAHMDMKGEKDMKGEMQS